MLNQKPVEIDGSTHVSTTRTYVERHEFKDHSLIARFRSIFLKRLRGTDRRC